MFCHLTILRHWNIKTSQCNVSKNGWVSPICIIFRHVRQFTVLLDHPVLARIVSFLWKPTKILKWTLKCKMDHIFLKGVPPLLPKPANKQNQIRRYQRVHQFFCGTLEVSGVFILCAEFGNCRENFFSSGNQKFPTLLLPSPLQQGPAKGKKLKIM